MRPWLGRDARRASAVLLACALGARDLVLAAGTLGSLSNTPALRRWLAGALIADGADFAVTLAAGDAIAAAGRALVLSIAAAGQALVLSIAGVAVGLGAAALASLG